MTADPLTHRIRRVLVTGISGNLGGRLAPLLESFEVVSIDLRPPARPLPLEKFVQLDLSSAAGQQQLGQLLETERIQAVLHLAFVLDPVRTGIEDKRRMWRTNVEATRSLLESVARINCESTRIQLCVFPSSVSAYGAELPERVTEEAPLCAESFPYAIHKREADLICRQMHPRMGGCAMYVFRPHIYAGRSVDNFILRAFRGKASGKAWLARLFNSTGMRLPTVLPGFAKGENLFQFVHIDDVARVLHWTLDHFRPGGLQVFNLAGWGPPLSFSECARLARTPILRLPSRNVVTGLLRFFWAIGLSGVPPESLPYFLGSYTMDTTRLEQELGENFKRVVHYSSRDAFLDAVNPST